MNDTTPKKTMAQPTTPEQISNRVQTATARGEAKKHIVEGRMRSARIRHLIHKPRPGGAWQPSN